MYVCRVCLGAGTWGQFTVQAIESFDGGQSWSNGQVIYAPKQLRKAGSPQVRWAWRFISLRCSVHDCITRMFPRIGTGGVRCFVKASSRSVYDGRKCATTIPKLRAKLHSKLYSKFSRWPRVTSCWIDAVGVKFHSDNTFCFKLAWCVEFSQC